VPKIRIAHIITTLELGGAQKTTLLLLKYIEKQDYEVHLVTSKGAILEKDAASIPWLNLFFIPSLDRKISPINDAVSLYRIIKYLKAKKISIVHTHSSKAGIIGRWAAKIAGAKGIFHTVHGWPFYIETNKPVKWLYVLLEKITALITTKLVVVSDADLEAGLKYINRDIKKYIKIPYGIERGLFLRKGADRDKEFIKTFGIKEDSCIVGYISCFKPQKAPLDFIKTVRLVINKGINAQFICIGEGPLKPAAENLASRFSLNGHIKFLGWQRHIERWMSLIDILVLTSRWEGLPVVFIEALASGVPIVTTDVGGAREIVKNGLNGFLTPKGDCEGMAKHISFLASDCRARREFGEYSKKSFKEEFDISFMLERVKTLYKDYDGQNRGRP
jgi:glycosyltransferase involved in cell wall biosynthesis